MRLRITILSGFLLLLIMAGCGHNGVVTEVSIVPEPVFVTQKNDTYKLHSHLKIHFQNLGQNTDIAKYISKSLRKMRLHPSFSGKSTDNDLSFILNDSVNQEIGEEGYLLEIRTDGISISANTEAGLFYGFQSFLQLLPPDASKGRYSKVEIPCCTILDYPRFEWRGSQLDVCHHFFNVKQLKRYIDVLSVYKFNKLNLHLADDYGWRVQIDSFPLLTQVGAYRPDRDTVSWYDIEPPKGDEECSYGGYYTKEDIADLVSYAATRHVEIIPELSLPNHCSAVLAGYPEFSCDGAQYAVQVGSFWPQNASLCVGDGTGNSPVQDSVMKFVFGVLEELVEMFPGKYIGINYEDCQGKETEYPQKWFLEQVDSFLLAKDRHLIGWEEITRGVSPDRKPMILSWKNAEEAISGGWNEYGVVMCPPEYTWLDYYQANPTYQPTAMGNENNLRHTYEFDPIPAGSNHHLNDFVKGGQCFLWTEFIRDNEELDYMVLPRLCAISESLWSTRESRDWYHFRHKMISHRQRLLVNGYNPSPGSFKPLMHRFGVGGNRYKVAFETELSNTTIHYTIDGSRPTVQSPVYTDPVVLPKGTVIKTLSVYDGEPRECVYEYKL